MHEMNNDFAFFDIHSSILKIGACFDSAIVDAVRAANSVTRPLDAIRPNPSHDVCDGIAANSSVRVDRIWVGLCVRIRVIVG